METSRLGLLLGNSTLRYGRFEGSRVKDCASLPWQELAGEDRPGGFLERIFGSGWEQDEVVVGSVRDDRLTSLEGGPGEVKLLVAGRDFELPIVNHYDDPEEVGVDRLLNAVAAGIRWPGEAVIVVDFGTALSFSVVSVDGEFLGGPIGVGVGAALAGLDSATPRLPGLEDGPALPLIAKSTAQALRAGVLGQARSGVEGLVQGIQAELGVAARVVATGGEAELVAKGLDIFDRIEPGLTLEGLAISAETGARL